MQSAATPGPGGGGDAGTGGTAGGGGGGGGRDGGSGQGSYGPRGSRWSLCFSVQQNCCSKLCLNKVFFKFNLICMTCMGNLESRSSDTLILAAGPGGRSSNRCGTGDDLEMVLDHAAERPEGRPRAAVRHDEVKGRQYEGHLLVV